MNDRYRKEYWGDPQKALDYQASFNAGCRGCLHDFHDKLKGWVCKLGIQDYPHKTRDDCKHWMRKHGKKS